ncbi:MAG: hypothetical protein V7L26_27310 [Nostoc sp.]|uniref:hypothetical protein n=1 Tax=Nostoc sp. TaxID=1180 RepID=UPI002FFB2D62
MFNRSFHNLFMESVILGATLLVSTSAHAEDSKLVAETANFRDNTSVITIAQTPKIPEINSDTNVQQTNSMSQVTSVSQFSDVQPTDWAFQALQSLVERYIMSAEFGWLFQMLRLWVGFTTLIGST